LFPLCNFWKEKLFAILFSSFQAFLSLLHEIFYKEKENNSFMCFICNTHFTKIEMIKNVVKVCRFQPTDISRQGHHLSKHFCWVHLRFFLCKEPIKYSLNVKYKPPWRWFVFLQWQKANWILSVLLFCKMFPLKELAVIAKFDYADILFHIQRERRIHLVSPKISLLQILNKLFFLPNN